jgi:hypothetical protein
MEVSISTRQDLWHMVSPRKKEYNTENTFAPMARYTSIRDIILIVAVMKWKVH